MKRPLNDEKNKQIKGKIIKSSMTFNENKPNFINSKIGVIPFQTSKYEILTAWRSKKANPSKPNLTPIKPNSNPIPERPKMNANLFKTMNYKKETAPRRMQTNPNKPNVVNNQSSLIDNQLRRQTQFKAGLETSHKSDIYQRNSLSLTLRRPITIMNVTAIMKILPLIEGDS